MRKQGLFFRLEESAAGRPARYHKAHFMERHWKQSSFFSLKLAYEEEGLSPTLRDEMIMGDYQKDIFELLVRRGDVETIQFKMNECLGLDGTTLPLKALTT